MKYHNVPVTLDGHRFDSKAEARRYGELRLLLMAGHIEQLNVHPRYPLKIHETLVCTYEADFVYHHVASKRLVIEDVKGMKTQAYRIKKKLFEALHPGLTITEVGVR